MSVTYSPLFVQINCVIHINRKPSVCITSFHNKNGSSMLIYFYLISVWVKYRAKQATKDQRGIRCIPTLFNLSPRWEKMVNTTPRPLYHRERAPGRSDGCGKSRRDSIPHRPACSESLYAVPAHLLFLVLLWKCVAHVAIIIRVEAEIILRTDGLADRDYN